MEKASDQPTPTSLEAQDAPRYDFDIDLGSDTTHARIVRLVGHDRRVLELGPATGYMSRVLVEHGCTVVGIEIDPEMAAEAARYCERVVVGDLDHLDLDLELGRERFDVVVAADVLEHLKDPLGALRRLRGFLEPGGFFVISLPNIAHGSVRLALLEGHFDYQKLGLLDETHLRFFTRDSIARMLDEAELGVGEIMAQELDFDASEIPFDRAGVPAELADQLASDPDARAYQFIIKAIPLDVPGLREVQRRLRDLAAEAGQLRADNRRLQDEVTRLSQPDPSIEELQTALAQIAGREGQLRASLIDAHEQLFQRDLQLNQLREELVPLRATLDRLRASPLGQVYFTVRRFRRAFSAVERRLRRYQALLRKL